jgi:hypothetical protein
MKNSLTNLAVVSAIVVLFSSCAANKEMASVRQAEINQSKENVNVCFVKYNDGTVSYFKSLKLIKGAFKTPHLLTDNGTEIYPKEIISYQNQDHFAISQTMFVTGKKSYISKEALPGFAVRIAKGQLNVYCKKFFNGNAAVDEYFLQSGNDGKIYAYTPQLMKSIIRDNYEALAIFEGNIEDMSKKLQSTADVFNNSMLVTKN